MIQKNTFDISYQLAQVLLDKGIKVTPKSETPLALLIQSGCMDFKVKHQDVKASLEDHVLELSKTPNELGEYPHDDTMDSIVQSVASTIRSNLDLARNVVNPLVKEIVENTQDYIDSKINQFNNSLTIECKFYNNIWDNPNLVEMVSRYSETQYKEVPLRLTIPMETTLEALKTLARTGASRFDEDLHALMDQLGEETVSQIYTQVFGVERKTSLSTVINVTDILKSNCNQIEQALIIHCFSRNLLLAIPEGMTFPLHSEINDLSSYKAYISDIVSQTGRIIIGNLKRREGSLGRKQLLDAYPQGKDSIGRVAITIPVNGVVYNQWVEEGGSPEIIFGAYVSDQERGYQTLLEKKEMYLSAWKKRQFSINTQSRLNKANFALEGLQVAIANAINGMNPDDLYSSKEALHQLLKRNMSLLKGKFYEDLYVNARMVLCKTVFPHTLALDILSQIDQIHKDNPEIEVREAALLSTVEVMAHWLTKLMDIHCFK